MFKKAIKKNLKLRLATFGTSGSGKTYSALRIATGLASKEGGRIAFIDTERGSASRYADSFDFDVLEVSNPNIETTVNAINAANGYSVLIIDSLSHPWKELLSEIEKIAKTKYRGNTWSAWSEGTPMQDKLVNAILDFKGHVIATMRSKTEWATEKDERTGKSKPVRIGLTPEQGKGIEYEFDMLLEINTEHCGSVLKDRTGKFQDATIQMPDENFGIELHAWLNSGIDLVEAAKKAIETTTTISGLTTVFMSYDKDTQIEIKPLLTAKKEQIIKEFASEIANENTTLEEIKTKHSLSDAIIELIKECAIDLATNNQQDEPSK